MYLYVSAALSHASSAHVFTFSAVVKHSYLSCINSTRKNYRLVDAAHYFFSIKIDIGLCGYGSAIEKCCMRFIYLPRSLCWSTCLVCKPMFQSLIHVLIRSDIQIHNPNWYGRRTFFSTTWTGESPANFESQSKKQAVKVAYICISLQFSMCMLIIYVFSSVLYMIFSKIFSLLIIKTSRAWVEIMTLQGYLKWLRC